MMTRFLVLAMVLCATVTAAADDPAAGAPVFRDDCPTVVRVHFGDRARLDAVARWIEPWEVDHEAGVLVVGVDAAGYDRLLAEGYGVEVDPRRTERLCAPLERLPGQEEGIPGFPCYRTVEETFAAAEALEDLRPDLVTWTDVGDSWEKTAGLGGYDLHVLRLTNSAVAGTPTGDTPPHGKPRLFVSSAIHARELATAELMTRFAEQLVLSHGMDADATWLLDEHEIHLMLHANPDGRKQAEGGQYWRKNTNQDYCGATSPDRGADLNRNFDYQWGCCGGSSGSECGETYRGPSPASEPETQAVQAYLRSVFPDQKGPDPDDPAPAGATGIYIDVHASGQLVLWPWGSTPQPAPNGTALQTLGRKMAFFNGHTPEQGYGLYPTDGTTDSFGYGDLGIAAYTFELGTEWFQDCAVFTGSILEGNTRSLLYAAKAARTPYLTPSGPDMASVELPGGNVVEPGSPLTVDGVVDDTRYNHSNGSEPSQSIAAAEVIVDLPPWTDPPPTATAMSAVDGSFDATQEAVTAVIDTTGLDQGRHTLFVLGQDAGGQWGAVSATFFYVLDPATAPRLEGTVVDADSGAPLEATVVAGGFSTISDPADGSYSLLLVEGTYDVTASAEGYGSVTTSGVTVTTGSITALDFLLFPISVLLEDDVEGGNLGWAVTAPWAITDESSASPTHSWTDSPGGEYGNDVDTSLTSPALDLSWVTGVGLAFSHIYDIEDGYDYGTVEYSSDGSTWQVAASYTGTNVAAWDRVEIDLSALDGATAARIRFRLTSDGWVTADGWHIDDIVLQGAPSPPPGLLFEDGFETGDTSRW